MGVAAPAAPPHGMGYARGHGWRSNRGPVFLHGGRDAVRVCARGNGRTPVGRTRVHPAYLLRGNPPAGGRAAPGGGPGSPSCMDPNRPTAPSSHGGWRWWHSPGCSSAPRPVPRWPMPARTPPRGRAARTRWRSPGTVTVTASPGRPSRRARRPLPRRPRRRRRHHPRRPRRRLRRSPLRSHRSPGRRRPRPRRRSRLPWLPRLHGRPRRARPCLRPRRRRRLRLRRVRPVRPPRGRRPRRSPIRSTGPHRRGRSRTGAPRRSPSSCSSPCPRSSPWPRCGPADAAPRRPPGGTPCRNGLFSPSPWWPPAPWWSSSR